MSHLRTYSKVTYLVDEEKAVDVVYPNFRRAFDTISHSILLEHLAAPSLDSELFTGLRTGCMTRPREWRGVELHPEGIQSLLVTPRDQYWGQSFFSILISDRDEGMECTLMKFSDQQQAGVGVFICWRVGRLCREIWTGWIDGPSNCSCNSGIGFRNKLICKLRLGYGMKQLGFNSTAHLADLKSSKLFLSLAEPGKVE
ncbi:hypothetical protein BTVI_24646 [Pitangus sulphuratus]|nr:hypothetical protein BTVI_24646 [Pitangus sulphuratus]